ncbi:kinase-like domain-containing protein [Amylocarpus encephaloides]|uniref:Altered inheritance of mitochondria protein 9, mitochondrial n=1 Tax=Amylocarpus encephaloides TaxID=45428 RepID=A0A9P8C5Q8_9HELO|nr:kinase-like domain-containing protein [Amylocarpus encephaloides]
MLGRLRQFCQPAPASQATRLVLAAATSRRALHTSLCVETEEYLQDPNDPYLYTTGRWLNRDKLRREARSVKFDFPALCKKAVTTCSGATKVIRYEKKEGGFNRVLILYLDNGERVVARVPFRIAGPRRLTTNSEVATMTYIRSVTKIPVPKILDWSDDGNNPIGTEYIIMEHVPGVQLHDKWPSMTPRQHMLCVQKVASMVTEMVKLPFPAYGSLYFADAPIDPKTKIEFAEGFCIGPHCGTQYWDCNAEEARFYKERPLTEGLIRLWTGLQTYCSGLTDAGFSRIPKTDPPVDELPYRGSVQEHLHLLNMSQKVIRELIKAPIIQQVASPALLHPDIHKRNIYVSEEDPSCVTGLIDWQSTSIEPTFVYANETPDLTEDPAANVPILKRSLPSAEDDASNAAETVVESPEEEPARKGREKDVWICRQTFEVVLKGSVPKLHDARAIDQTLLSSFRYCDTAWRDSAAALRQELIELSQRWAELELPGSCPYQPTIEELAEHAKQYEDFEIAQQLKILLKRSLNADSDRWVHAENWETAKTDHKALLDLWMESIKESGGSEGHTRKLWPFIEV